MKVAHFICGLFLEAETMNEIILASSTIDVMAILPWPKAEDQLLQTNW